MGGGAHRDPLSYSKPDASTVETGKQLKTQETPQKRGGEGRREGRAGPPPPEGKEKNLFIKKKAIKTSGKVKKSNVDPPKA